MSTICIAPFTLVHQNQNIAVPCGKCYNCLRRRVSAWSYRLMKHERAQRSANFLTLTYDTSHVPITERGFMSLEPDHVVLFMKRLRKRYPPKTISYFLCGEYGNKTMRPHYHAIMFNIDVEDVIQLWHYGTIFNGTVTEASVGYTLKYMMKPHKIPLHKNDDRVPEFQRMSKGIGKNYLSEAMHDWHHADMLNRYYCPLPDHKKAPMPRYYKDKIFSQSDRQYIGQHLSTIVEKPELTGQQEYEIFVENDRKLKKSRIIETL